MSTQKRGRGRPVKFSGKALKYVAKLVKEHGVAATQLILTQPAKAFGKPTQYGSLRNTEIFPKPFKTVSLPILYGIGKEVGMEFRRGRPNPIEGMEKHALELVKAHGASAAVKVLAQEGVTVCGATLRTLAKDNGVKLRRGPRVAA